MILMGESDPIFACVKFKLTFFLFMIYTRMQRTSDIFLDPASLRLIIFRDYFLLRME